MKHTHDNTATNKKLCIHHHLGLGDHFDCNGMVRFLLEEGSSDKVYVFSKSNSFNIIEYMYQDEDKIEVIKIDKEGNEYSQVNSFLKSAQPLQFLRVGFDQYPSDTEASENKNCWEYFYEQVQIPYNVRTDYFYVERDEGAEAQLLQDLNPTNAPYIFLHDDAERGYNINTDKVTDGYHVIRNDNTKNIFHFIKVLENAEEIHCMESSFKTLIDIYAKTANLYYHDFRGHPLGERTNRKWNIVSYA
tara:strand:- start:2326 stop:3063 length:738 start_codon:yes stop_codon:yes gene_type:complete